MVVTQMIIVRTFRASIFRVVTAIILLVVLILARHQTQPEVF